MKETAAGLVSSRRRALGMLGGLLASTGAARAVDNVYLGYGTIEGTNLLEQDLLTYAGERFGVHESTIEIDDVRMTIGEEAIQTVGDGGSTRETATPGATSAAEARRIDAELGLQDNPVEQLVADIDALNHGQFTFEFVGLHEFFERNQSGTFRPYTVAAVRGPAYKQVDPTLIAELSDTDPRQTAKLATGLAKGLRAHSEYDVERYLAGALEDNVLRGAFDLRSWFESPDDVEAIVSRANDGLFCTEIAHATIEAFHSVPAHQQSIPVACAHVADRRHKHAYTGLATVLRDNDELVVRMTFADYMNPLLNETLNLRWLLGDTLDAYDDGHRTTNIYWDNYAGIA